MSSSRNRFDVLEESSSRSKEQKRTLDSGSTISDDVADNRSCAAKDDDGLQQAILATLESGSNASAAPSQKRRERTPLIDEEEELSKRQRMESLSPNLKISEPTTPTPSTVPDSEPEQPSSDSESDKCEQRPYVPDPPCFSPSLRFLDTGDIENPETPLFCIAQANDGPLVGSFSADTEGCALRLTIDAGPWNPPKMRMELFCNGTDMPAKRAIGWRLDKYNIDGFGVRGIKFYRVADYPGNVDLANPNVLAACETDEEKNRLVCVYLSIARDWGPDWRSIPKEDDENLDKFVMVFYWNRAYHLRIWFIAPYDLDDLEERCLVFFLLYMELRRPPVSPYTLGLH